jgi:hypothetical protein
MMIILASLLLLLVSASVAHAECAWVLWVDDTQSSPLGSFATKEECETRKQQALSRNKDLYSQQRLNCYPDTMDPRPKGWYVMLLALAGFVEGPQMMTIAVLLGGATTHPPVGYVATQGRQWTKDPDPRVRDAVQFIFDKFLELGTTGALARNLHQLGMKIPTRRWRGIAEWKVPPRTRLFEILKHPAMQGSTATVARSYAGQMDAVVRSVSRKVTGSGLRTIMTRTSP